MCTRISSIVLLAIAATGCGPSDRPADGRAAARAEPPPAASVDDGRVPCARGAGALQRVCTVEEGRDADGLLLTIRYPDGGVRRLRVVSDGRGVVVADGAEPAGIAIVGSGDIEVTVATDRFRLPATVKRPS